MIAFDELKEEIFKMVEVAEGKKNIKAMDVQKEMEKRHGDSARAAGENIKNMVKYGIKDLVDSGRLVYSYFGGSFLTLPKVEGAAKRDYM
jgi:hypothetical protein